MPRRKAARIPDELLDQLLAGTDPKTAFDADGLLDGLKKALAERALNTEMDHHLATGEGGNGHRCGAFEVAQRRCPLRVQGCGVGSGRHVADRRVRPRAPNPIHVSCDPRIVCR